MRFSHDSGLFSASRIRIRIIDTDPNLDPEGQNDADPDPRHWLKDRLT